MQPILGATEEAFKSIFRAPRSERKRAEEDVIRALDETIERVREAGVDIEVEDAMPEPSYASPPVTLSDLHEFVGDDLAAGGRPVTFDAARPSRDPTSWVALGTYGHPRLDEILERIAAGAPEGEDAALVIAEADGAAAAFRADRMPPEAVQSLAGLESLGSATSLGDAEEKALAEATATQWARRERIERVRAARVESSEEDIRRRVADLVREAVRSECAAARARGNEIGPLLAWQELKRDTINGFGYVEQFAQRLHVDLNHVVPMEVASDETVTLTRQDAGTRLYALIEEWKAQNGFE